MRPLIRRGFTLAETIVALFILVGIMLGVVNLLHSMLRYSSTVEKRSVAGVAAEKLLEEIRAAAATPAGFAGVSAAYDGTTRTDPEFPDITLQASVTPYAALDPCTGLESSFAGPKTLSGSLLRVRVTAGWDGHSLQVTSLVGEPPRVSGLVQVNLSGPGSLTAGTSTTLTAVLLDSGGQPIPDVVFHWSVVVVSGNGTVSTLTRDGRQARLTHSYAGINVPGDVRIQATAHYLGQEVSGLSNPITLL